MPLFETIRSIAVRFGNDESAATAIEYAMIAAGVGGCLVATVMGLGTNLKGSFYDKLLAMFP